MSFTTLENLFCARLAAFSTEQSLEVAWENKTFTPPENDAYLEPTLMLATPRAAGLGSDAADYQRGVFQIDVCALKNTRREGRRIADLLRAKFPRGLKMAGTDANITVESFAIGPPINGDTRYQLPASVTFYAYMDAA